MEMTLEGSNSAETFPPQDGVARLHRSVTGTCAIWCDNCCCFFFVQKDFFLTIFLSTRSTCLISSFYSLHECVTGMDETV